jgi:hypothetical protein
MDDHSDYDIPAFRRLVTILCYQLHIDFPSDLSPTGFPTKILYALFLSPCELHAQPIASSLNLSIYIWRRIKVTQAFIVQLSPTHYRFVPLPSKYSPQKPLLNHRRLHICLSLNIRDHFSLPYKIMCKILLQRVLILKFLDSTRDYKRF